MKIGYCRVSTTDQNPQLQIDALLAIGCNKIFTDKASGVKAERPQLAKALQYCQKGDVFVCWKLDRVARSVVHLLRIMEDLNFREVDFKCLTQPIDTATAVGRMTFVILGAVAEFERELIRERTVAGLKTSRKKAGRKPTITKEQINAVLEKRSKGMKAEDICAQTAMSPASMYRILQKAMLN